MRRPGDLIKIKEFLYDDMMGFAWCIASDGGIVRSKRILSKKEKKTLKRRLNQDGEFVVTCVPGGSPAENIYLFEMDNRFENELIDYYYEKKKNGKVLTGKGKNIKDWVDRFSIASDLANRVTCNHPFSKDISKKQKLPPFVKWKTVVSDTWRLPVFASSVCDWLNDAGPYHFQPIEQFSYGFFHPACNRIAKNFPIKLNAKIISSTGSGHSKKVSFVLYGFRSPKHWHYKFMKHVACVIPSSGEITKNFHSGREERKLWEMILKKEIPQKDLFNKCLKRTKNICNHCNQNQFNRIHYFAEESLLEYLNLAVTLIEKAKTKRMKVGKYLGNIPLHRVIIGCLDNANPQKGNYLTLGLRGTCYNWEADIPVIHLVIRTMFFKSNPSIWGSDTYNDPYWRKADNWRIGNVSRETRQ